MGNDGLKSSSKHSRHHNNSNNTAASVLNNNNNNNQHLSKDDDEIELSKPQRRMDKIRRSLSFRKKKNKQNQQHQPLQTTTITVNNNNNNNNNLASNVTTTNNTNTTTTTNNNNNNNNNNSQQDKYQIDTTKPTSWQDDERKVRDGTCSFHVKYLGSIEVFDSRGMHICEQAIERLITNKKKTLKAILYVSGDSLRVVDETNKTLIVDQTIEKVSFCAPDRFHDNGFAYICRDGTTRRWLCHGFLAIKDTIRNATSNSSGGERLSHAVGCAFSVCLERKQKRERENVTMEVGPNHSFTRLGSFRQASLTERLEDPQIVIPAAEPAPIKRVDNPYAIERPKGNVEILQRQNSLRSYQGTFKRNTNAYASLKPGELPSFQAQKLNSIFNNKTSTTTTSTNSTPTTTNNQLQFESCSQIGDNKINTISELPEETTINESNSIIISPTPPPLPPLPAQLSYRSTTSTSSSNNQQQIQPPPLPPLPQQFANFTNFNQTKNITEPQLSISPQPSGHSFWTQPQQNNFFNTPILNTQTSIFPTPITPPQYQQTVYNNNYPYTQTPSLHQQQFYNQSLYQPITTSTSTTQAPPANETFEAKWARIQASKKITNPFAEDIAKKYEIKL